MAANGQRGQGLDVHSTGPGHQLLIPISSSFGDSHGDDHWEEKCCATVVTIMVTVGAAHRLAA